VPAIVGLSAAYAKNHATMYEVNEKLQTLRALFLKELSTLGGVTVNGENSLPAILNLRIEGISNVDVLYKLDLSGVQAAAGSACASASIQPSHVLTAMGLTEKEANESLRFSLGKHTTEEEVIQAAAILKEIVEKLRAGK
jgi:cysteine desulfurase